MMTTAVKITKLEEALASGVLTVESDGERLTYRSEEGLLRAISYFKQQLASEVASSALRRPASTLAVFDPN